MVTKVYVTKVTIFLDDHCDIHLISNCYHSEYTEYLPFSYFSRWIGWVERPLQKMGDFSNKEKSHVWMGVDNAPPMASIP